MKNNRNKRRIKQKNNLKKNNRNKKLYKNNKNIIKGIKVIFNN